MIGYATLAIVSGGLIGLSLGATGGGGFVIVPALVLVLGFPVRMAVGTSLLIIALISIGGLAGHLQFGQLDGRAGGARASGERGRHHGGNEVGTVWFT